ncbi:MAG: ribonuclease P protein component [Pseudomonadales bacterium]
MASAGCTSGEPSDSPASSSSGQYGFTKHQRLLSAKDYSPVFAKADFKVSNKTLLILARPNTLGISRLGLVVSKKNVRHAVQRNRVKRVTRDSFRHQQHILPAIDIVVLARRGLGELSNTELHSELNRLWNSLLAKASNKKTYKGSNTQQQQRQSNG